MKHVSGVRLFLRSIKEDVKSYLALDPAMKNVLQLIFFNAAFHGLLFYRISHLFYFYKIYPLSFIFYYLSRVLFAMDIHPAAVLEPGVVIDHGIGVVIGSTTRIGSGTIIYQGVTLGARRTTAGKRHPDIGKNVLIGAGAKVLGPIRVGNNARIGANAVVLTDVPDNSVVVGIPAKIVQERRIGFAQFDREHTYGETENRTKSVLEA